MADASASAPQSPADDPAPPTTPDMASQVLASYADTAMPSAAADWTDGTAQASAADASTPLGVQHQHGASPTTDAGQAAAGTTDHMRMHHS